MTASKGGARTALETAPLTEVRNLDLEAAIEADLERDEPFLVYGDWLSTHGNPRGELISLQASGVLAAGVSRGAAPRSETC